MTKEEFYDELDWSEWTRENEFRFSKPVNENCNLYVAVGVLEEYKEGKTEECDAMFFWTGKNPEYFSPIITECLRDLDILSPRLFKSRRTNRWYRTMPLQIAVGNSLKYPNGSLLPVYFW